uniref:Uncharacterized protein n=1 Tax=Sphaerodactylus townsendi TaxID=933632 RepID=A0ACB8EHJ6_9SAUR
MEHKDPVEHESDEEKMLTNGTTPEGGPGKVPICYQKDAPDKEKLVISLDARQQDACQKCQKEKKKNRVLTFIVAVLVFVIVVIIPAVVLVVQRKESPATPSRTLCPSDGLCRDWIHRGNWCYCSFDEERDWDFSRRNCSSSGTSFLTLDSEEDWVRVLSKLC